MQFQPATRQAYRLLHEGSLALADMEANGIRVDIPKVRRTIRKTNNNIQRIEEDLRKQEVFKIWKREYGSRTKLDSTEQLGHVLFNCLDYKPIAFTAGGKPKTDEESLELIDLPFARDYVRARKLKKLVSTYLIGFMREVVYNKKGWALVHPFFNLHDIITYRSSSDRPNLQNIPARNPEIAALIRRCFIPRDGHYLLDLDFKSVEVKVAACYTKDPVLLKYCNDPKTDMHKDMALRLFMLREDQVTEVSRFSAKNNFVFAQFYGDYFINCARNLWESLEKENVRLEDGTPMKKHLKRKGVFRLGDGDPEHVMPGTFEQHVKKVEDWYWNTQYKVYTKWKDKWWDSYVENAGFSTYTGFTIEGVLTRNQVLNSPIQGSAFHCCLWLVTRLNEWLKKRKMRSLLVGEVHDSVILDVHEDELDAVVNKTRELLEQLRDEWDWIVVPLNVEAKISDLNGNWHVNHGMAI